MGLVDNAWGGINSLFAKLTGLGQGGKTSRRDVDRDLVEITIKRKLGAAFFTRQNLTRRSRERRVSELTSDELAIARDNGWI